MDWPVDSAMIRLIGRELRQLWPYALLWCILIVLFYGAELATLRIDEESYLSWCKEYCDVGTNVDLVLFSIVFYMIAAYSLFPREFDDATIDFLRSLPISRGAIFLSKVLAVWMLLTLLLALDKLVQTILLSFNTQSLTGRTYFAMDATFMLRDTLFAFVIAAHGIFLSWFRTTGLIFYAIYLIALIWLEQMLGMAGVYSIFRFYNNEYFGQKIILDWTVIGFHITVALVLLACSYLLWTKTDSKPKNPAKSKMARFVPVILTIFGFLLVTGSMLGLMNSAQEQAQIEDIKTTETAHYNFSYRGDDQKAIDALTKVAEQDFESMVDLLSAHEKPKIFADMTSDGEHALGLASWKKIRMVLDDSRNAGPLPRRVLSHETAHVFQSVESKRALTKAGNAAGFFIEGMAQYASFNIVPDKQARSTNWLISSVAWSRQDIKFPALANRVVFESLYDPEMLYGIGDIWTDAMVQVCGQESLGNFLRSTGRDEAPPNLSGVNFWRHHLQHIECELEAVNNRWRKIMQQLVTDRSTGAFPHFKNVVVEPTANGGLIRITAEVERGETGELPQQFYLRIKNETSLAKNVSPVLSGDLVEDGLSARVEFLVLRKTIEGTRFRFQMGFTPFPESRNYYDEWRSGSVSK